MSTKQPTIIDILRDAIEDYGLWKASRDSGIPYSTLYRFTRNGRSMGLDTAVRLVSTLGLTLTPTDKKERSRATRV